MRVQLEWDRNPSDLDLWIRAKSCSDALKRQDKLDYSNGDEPITMYESRTWYLNDGTWRWGNSDFNGSEKKYVDKAGLSETCDKAWGSSNPWDLPRHTGTTNECKAPKNQANKIANYNTQRVAFLQKCPSAAGWQPARPDDGDKTDGGISKFELDVDARYGFGPETMTLTSVPPGRYEVIVHNYSPSYTVSGYDDSVRSGNPRVTVIIGSNSVVFSCNIDQSCRRASPLWKALEIGIEPTSVTGEYKVKLYTGVATRKVQYDALRTSDKAEWLIGSRRRRFTGASRFEFLKNNWGAEGSTDNLCATECMAVQEAYDSCIDDN
jgi:hypothetical protein